MAHQSDTPYLPRQGSETAADFNPVLAAETSPHRRLVYSRRAIDRIEHRQAEGFLNDHFQPQLPEAPDKHCMTASVAGENRVETLGKDGL